MANETRDGLDTEHEGRDKKLIKMSESLNGR